MPEIIYQVTVLSISDKNKFAVENHFVIKTLIFVMETMEFRHLSGKKVATAVARY